MYLHEALQTVVTDDDATVEVIEVRGSETSAVQWNERTKLWRSNREDLHNHPLRTVLVAVLAAAVTEGLNHLQALQSLCLALYGCLGAGLVAQLVRESVEVQVSQKLIDSLGTHLGDELVGIAVLEKVIIGIQTIIYDVDILLLADEVETV